MFYNPELDMVEIIIKEHINDPNDYILQVADVLFRFPQLLKYNLYKKNYDSSFFLFGYKRM